MEVFDKPRIGGVYSGLLLPSQPTAFRPNWGVPLLRALSFLLLPHPSGFYYDIVKGRRAIFGGANASGIVPVLTKFGYGYQFGVAAGGQNAYATAVDGAFQPPSKGLTVAIGAYNQATIGNVLCSFCNWQNASQTNRLGVYVNNYAGTPRMECIIEAGGVDTNLIANGGAGITMVTSGQYLTYSGSYDGINLLANYNTTGLGNQTGATTSAIGFPSGINSAAISDTVVGGNINSARTMLWMAGWNRALSAAELVTVCAPVGGLPAGWLRHG